MCASPREALNDPTLILLFKASNLLRNEFDHDLVIDVLEVVEALLDASAMWAGSLDMIAEELASADTLPFEVLGESL